MPVHEPDRVEQQRSHEWGISCLNLLGRVFGKDSDHYIKFNGLFPRIGFYIEFLNCLGIMRGAKDDYDHDYLFDTRVLITAEVFSEFVEQARYLLDSHYYQPAAVIAGSVLEDGLRKLCVRAGIVLPQNPKLDWMNTELVKKNVYNGLVQKKITALADIRNKAAHGKWNEFNEADVADLIKQVNDFMADHF